MINLFYKSNGKSRLSGKNRLIYNIKSGFTLVEIIIVLTIIAIMATLTIPSLIGYIDSSKEKIAVAECRNVVTAAQYLANDEYDEYGTTGDTLKDNITESAILTLAEEESTSESSLAMMLPDLSFGIMAYADDSSYEYGAKYDDITIIENKPIPEDKKGKSFIESYKFDGYTLSHMIYLSKNGIWLEYTSAGDEIVKTTTVTTINDSYSVVFKNGDKIISIRNYNSGESVTPPELNKEGYKLKGWNCEQGETKSSLAPAESFTVSGSEKKIIYKAVLEAQATSVTPSTEPSSYPDPEIKTEPSVTTADVEKPTPTLPEPFKEGGQLFTIVQDMVNGYDNDNQSTHYANYQLLVGHVYEYGGEYYYHPEQLQLGYNRHPGGYYEFVINGNVVMSGTNNPDIDAICMSILDYYSKEWGAKPIKMDFSNSITVNNNFNNWNRGDVIGSDGLIAITEDKSKAFVYVGAWNSWQEYIIN